MKKTALHSKIMWDGYNKLKERIGEKIGRLEEEMLELKGEKNGKRQG
jgi:hypothetical protein